MQSGQDHVGGGVQFVEDDKPFVITAMVDGRPRAWAYETYGIALLILECLLKEGTVPGSIERVTNPTFSDRRCLRDNIATHDRRLANAENSLAEIRRIAEKAIYIQDGEELS